MSRGMGRGGYSSSRGGSTYRGSSGRGSSWGERSSGRGSFSSSRGGGRFPSSWGNTSSFDSRSRYNSSSNNERYSSASRGRQEDSSYRRSSYRSEGPTNSYSSRDNSTRSPDRKRLRTEAPSSRRSHDAVYGADASYSSSRYETSTPSYAERRSFTDDRRPTVFARPRDDYRKPIVSSTSTRASPRGGGFRGRSRGARGGPRLSIRDTIVRRRIVDGGAGANSYVRKRGATIRSTDYIRRLRIARLRSAATRRTAKKSKSSEKEDSEKEEENWDDEVVDEEPKKPKETPTKPDDEKRDSPTKKSPKKDGKDDKEVESDKEEKKSGSEDEERPRSKYTGRKFIRLTCIHCGMKCVTFREYTHHLVNSRHILAMRKVAMKQKSVLARMRQAQRSTQRELEKTDEALAPRTIFCPLCKLNYRQMKSKHQLSDAHRNMKKFLMPYCRVCHITFKSPMLYENHLCSLEHIKRKAQSEVANGEKNSSEKDPESPTEEDLENFMTLDSVGDVDEEDEDGNKIPKSPTDITEGVDASGKPKESINVGVEHVKKVEVYYCDLCHIYLSRHEDAEKALKQHCRGRMHLQRYVRYKEDKDLRRQAERIHRKSQEAKEAKEKEKEKDKVKTESTEGTEADKDVKTEPETTAEEDAVDDKMWADVDKDLGEILAEVNNEPGNKSSDEDEDSRPDGERYDRFRYSEKAGTDELKTDETKAKEGDKDVVAKETEEEEVEIKEDDKQKESTTQVP